MPQRQDLQKQINQHLRRLQILKEHQARMGGNAPPEIIIEIEDIEAELERLATALQNADDTPEPAYVSPGDESPLSESIDRQIDTGGGSYYEGSIDTGGGNFVGHDYIVQEQEERRTKLFRNCGISVLVVLLGLVVVALCVFGGWAVWSLEEGKDLLTPAPAIPIAKKLHYFVILDASARMKIGDGKKWDMAQDTVQTLLESALPSRANYGLIVVGGVASDDSQACDYPQQPTIQLGLDSRDEILNTVKQLQPGGAGSLGKAIVLAREELLELSNEERVA